LTEIGEAWARQPAVFCRRSTIPVVNTSSDRQQHIRRHANGEGAIAIVDAQSNLEGPDVPLGAADIALCG
jgi:hypothetical protein